MNELIDAFRQAPEVSAADVHFADLMHRLDGRGEPLVWLAAAMASQATGEGHVCLDLEARAGEPFAVDGQPPLTLPALETFRERLESSPVVGRPGDFRPLILVDDGRLYLQRYWTYEQDLARALRDRAAAVPEGLDEARLKAGLARLFAHNDDQETDWQRVAAAVALLGRFAVISGGPGTGKTSTVVRLLALILEQSGGYPPRIALAAPTGKAAARMQESIRNALEGLPVDEDVREAMPDEARTLHRLLGVRPHSLQFRHHRDNPLPVDVLIVDEASMVDISMMARLVDALPPEARLILLGDRDQLASVEAGAVLSELGQGGERFSDPMTAALSAVTGMAVPAEPGEGIDDCVVQLQHSYRFGADSGIGRLARAINAGDGEAAWGALTGEADDVRWMDSHGSPCAAVAEAAVNGYRPCLEAMRDGAPAEAVLAAFEQYRVLTALRRGGAGVEALNGCIETALARAGLIRPRGRDYPGRPVMILHNDPVTRLYNGDVGLMLPDEEGVLWACFPSTEGVRRLHPAQLSAHESVFAMTVHKSQGSEFDAVLFVLPPENTPLLARELLYTGVTRARKEAVLLGERGALEAGCRRRVRREGGLARALRG